MLDARSVFRKVTRKIFDFSPEQMKNLAAIVWLHRGETDRFLRLIDDYLWSLQEECGLLPPMLDRFNTALAEVRLKLDPVVALAAKGQGIMDDAAELNNSVAAYDKDRDHLLDALAGFRTVHAKKRSPTNAMQHAARHDFDSIAEAMRGLVKQIDLLYKLASRLTDQSGDAAVAKIHDRRASGRSIKHLDEERKAAVEQLKQTVYVHRQIAWLHERFPDAELRAIPGLVRLVDRTEMEGADWSLTPGRYVGATTADVDDDFDFEQTMRDIHVELADLNREAADLAAKIQTNIEELGA